MKIMTTGMFMLLCASALPAAPAKVAIDPESSSVTVDVKATGHSFTCDLERYEADIVLDPETGSVHRAEFVFNLSDLETHNDSRNEKMEGWMEVETYNAIRWTLDSIEETPDGLVAHGRMSMHGVTMPVDVQFSETFDEQTCMLEGNAVFNHLDFGLPKIRLFLFTVNPELHVNFALKGTLASAE